jgi:hypothetical protein
MKKAVVFVALFVFAGFVVFGQNEVAQEQETQTDFSAFYENEIFKLDFGVMNGVSLRLQNEKASPFFLKPFMLDAINTYPDSKKEYKNYQWKAITGNVLTYGGMATAIVGALMPVMNPQALMANPESTLSTMIGLAAGGIVVEVIGVFIRASGQKSLYKSVNLYNTNRVRDYK